MLIDAIESYLKVRRAAGYELRTWGDLLLSFGRFAESQGDQYVRNATAQKWAALGKSPPQRERRLQTVARFAKFAKAEEPKHEVPPRHVFCHSPLRRPTPFIFTVGQIDRMLEEAGNLSPAGSIRPHTYQALFALLAATGLRISEALALRMEDMTPDGLVIRKTKFRKSRLVPIHPSVVTGLQGYLRHRAPHKGCHLFVLDKGQSVNYEQAQYAFRKVLTAAAISVPSGGPRAGLHSLRHTFAVRSLETCPDDPIRVARHMMALTTYLGHTHVANTYWYLQATVHIMGRIADSCEVCFQGETS
jgi:integrase